MQYVPAIIITLVIIAIIIAAMLWGWRGQKRRHSGFQLPEVPTQLSAAVHRVAGFYVATTYREDLLRRFQAAGLGNRGNCVLEIFPEGVLFTREGEDDLYLPAELLTDVQLGRGQIGKFVEKDGLILLGWHTAGSDGEELELQTGFRPRYAEDKNTLRDALMGLTANNTKEIQRDHA